MGKNSPVHLVVEESYPIRLDKFLAKVLPDYSRTFYKENILEERVSVNGTIEIKARRLVSLGDEVIIEIKNQSSLQELQHIQPEQMHFSKIYEDEMVIIINKPRGLVVHPAPGHLNGTVANGLAYEIGHSLQEEFPEDFLRPGIVHRLDQFTSGILITAKNRQAQALYSKLFEEKIIKKHYIAICCGIPKKNYISTHITRNPKKRKEMMVADHGKLASTHCNIIASNDRLSLVLLSPETGRTHQLRVHMKYLGTPILGDPVYGSAHWNKVYRLQEQQLHAFNLNFIKPLTYSVLNLHAPLPNDMKSLISKEFKDLQNNWIENLNLI